MDQPVARPIFAYDTNYSAENVENLPSMVPAVESDQFENLLETFRKT